MAGLGSAGARNSRRISSDEELIRALYAEHAAPLLRYAVHLMSGDRQRAEDIVQETLLRAWQHPGGHCRQAGPAVAVRGRTQPGNRLIPGAQGQAA